MGTPYIARGSDSGYFANYELIPSASACPGVTIKSLNESCITGSEKDFAEEFAWKLWLYRGQDIDFEFKD